MPTDAATAIAYVGASMALVGGGVALFNARKAVCWKRAELANTYMKDFNNNPELVFAGRCLDWQGGKLIVPESLRPYLPDGAKTIEHDRTLYAAAVSPFPCRLARWTMIRGCRFTEHHWTCSFRGSRLLAAHWIADFFLLLTSMTLATGWRKSKVKLSYIRSSLHMGMRRAYKS